MKIINIFGKEHKEEGSIIPRVGCRGIVIKDNKILVSFENNTGTYMIPGGGLDDNETDKECCIRELIEEAGIITEIEDSVLEINEYYGDTKWINRYFICKEIGRTEQSLTEEELSNDLIPLWMPLHEILDIFSQYENMDGEDNMLKGLYFREYTALKEIFNLK